MSILLPNAQQFVIVTAQLLDELKKHEIFNQYFSDKQHQLKLHDSSDEFNPTNYPDLSQTLFIVKYFDVDPQVHNNNNHSVQQQKPVDNEVKLKSHDETELESVGYTTDYDDIDDDVQTYDSAVCDPGYIFSTLMSYRCCIMGPMALLQTIRKLESLSDGIRMVPSERPLHNLAMHNTLISFSGIQSKQEAQQLLTLTRYMGAKSREDVTVKTTHLVAGNPRGFKYRRALELGLAVMSTNWVLESFRLAQSDIDFDAVVPEIIQHYKLKPFDGLRMAFVGFKNEDVEELSELTRANKGCITEADDLSCTHIVIDAIRGFDDTNTQLLSSINQNSSAHVVYKEWFWASLEMEGKASEDAYSVPGFDAQTPKRRSSRARRASTGFNSFSNVLSPMLDYSRSPDSMMTGFPDRHGRAQSVSRIEEERDLSKVTARRRACLELLQTERNYVKILGTIVNLFKVPLENPDIVDPILPATDVKLIFGNLTPIFDVHTKMLENLVRLIESEWNEHNCIGKVFVAHSVELIKAYPPFVNFFEDTKKTINACDQKYPRFHAFLKRCQSKGECNRESLTEMLIRPVQRLPSISLLLTELIKRTDELNPDKKYLVEALESIRRVMNLINEDKRKTEGQIAMFDIVNNIEDCPPNLLSSMRRFICKVEARLLFMNDESGVVPSRSHKLILFLFSDLIEICKIRSLGRSHSSKGNRTYVPIRRGVNQSQASKFSNKKAHRHLDELRLYDIMKIYKKCQFSEISDAFVIQARPSTKYDQNFRYYPFIIEDDLTTKDAFIEQLELCICSCDDPDQAPDYVPNDQPVSSEEIDFGFANQLVNRMEKSRLSRVLSIRQSLLSPSLKGHRNQHHHTNH